MSTKQHAYQLIKDFQDLDPVDFIMRIFEEREMPKMNENPPFFVGRCLKIEDPFLQFILPIKKSLKFNNQTKKYILIYDFDEILDFFENLDASEYDDYFKFLDKLFEIKVKAYSGHYQNLIAEKEKAVDPPIYDDIPF